MNYSYDSEMFFEITFPKRDVPRLLVRPSNVERVREVIQSSSNTIVTEIIIKKATNEETTYYFDGTLEDFQKNCKRVYL